MTCRLNGMNIAREKRGRNDKMMGLKTGYSMYTVFMIEKNQESKVKTGLDSFLHFFSAMFKHNEVLPI